MTRDPDNTPAADTGGRLFRDGTSTAGHTADPEALARLDLVLALTMAYRLPCGLHDTALWNDGTGQCGHPECCEPTPGCDCTTLCSMGPTCPGGMAAGLPGAGCWRTDGSTP